MPCCWGRGWAWGLAKRCARRRRPVGSATWFRPRRRARAMAGFMMAVPVGIMLSFGDRPVRWRRRCGWRAALAVAAIPGDGAGAGGVVAERTGKRSRVAADGGGGTGALLRGVLVDRGIGGDGEFCALQFLDVPAGVSDALSRDCRWRRRGVWTGIGSGVAGIAGAVAAGLVGDRAVKNRTLLAGGGGVAGGGASGVRGDSHAGGQRGDRGVAGDDWAMGCCRCTTGWCTRRSGRDRAGGCGVRAMAVYFMVTYLGGASLGPLVTGRLSDFLARRSGLAVGGVARRGAARCDVRDSGAGGGAGGGAVDGGTAGGCVWFSGAAHGG